jgi:hypothetical protein
MLHPKVVMNLLAQFGVGAGLVENARARFV